MSLQNSPTVSPVTKDQVGRALVALGIDLPLDQVLAVRIVPGSNGGIEVETAAVDVAGNMHVFTGQTIARHTLQVPVLWDRKGSDDV